MKKGNYDKGVFEKIQSMMTLEQKLSKYKTLNTDCNNDWIDKFKSKAGINELSKPVIDDLINNIYICAIFHIVGHSWWGYNIGKL